MTIYEQLFGAFLFFFMLFLGYVMARLTVDCLQDKEYVIAGIFSFFFLMIGLIGFVGFGIMVIGHIPQ